jgi:hypothetical protein
MQIEDELEGLENNRLICFFLDSVYDKLGSYG